VSVNLKVKEDTNTVIDIFMTSKGKKITGLFCYVRKSYVGIETETCKYAVNNYHIKRNTVKNMHLVSD